MSLAGRWTTRHRPLPFVDRGRGLGTDRGGRPGADHLSTAHRGDVRLSAQGGTIRRISFPRRALCLYRQCSAQSGGAGVAASFVQRKAVQRKTGTQGPALAYRLPVGLTTCAGGGRSLVRRYRVCLQSVRHGTHRRRGFRRQRLPCRLWQSS